MPDQQQRQHFRILYPVNQFAKLMLPSGDYKIVDLSQRGLKFQLMKEPNPGDFAVDSSVKGRVIFLNGSQAMIEGKVLRIADGFVILHLIEEIPLKIMYDEHRFIINAFSLV